MTYQLQRKDWLQIATLTFLGIISTWTVKFPGSKFSAANSVAIYWIEVVLILVALYVVGIQYIVKKQLHDQSPLVKFLFWTMLAFGVYWAITTGVRIWTHTLLPASFLLPRVVIEAALLYMCLDYFKVQGKTILIGLGVMFITFILWDYYILFLGDGVIRGTSPVMGNSYALAIFYGMMYPIGASLYCYVEKKYRLIIVGCYILSLPIIALTGSRTGLLLSIVLALFAFLIEERKIGKMIVRKLVMVFFALTVISLILLVGDNESKNQTIRSISVPIQLVKKIVPEEYATKITEMTSFQVTEVNKETGKEEIVEKNMDKEGDISSNQRNDVNNRAYASIFKNPVNFLFGTGNSLIRVYSGRLEKPHNYFSQYLMAFGLIGIILSTLVYFAPLFFSWFTKDKRHFLRMLILAYSSICINGTMQPALGNYLLILLMVLIAYSLKDSDVLGSLTNSSRKKK